MPPAVDDLATDDVVERLAELSVWGFPLVVMHRTRAGQLRTAGPRLDRDELATAESRAVVGPNNDTLYTSCWFDLRDGELVISVPRFADPDRYWSVMLLDAYTHVAYVSRRTHGRAGAEVEVTLDPALAASQAASGTDGADVVGVATPTVWVLIRVLVDGPDDLTAARVAQRSIEVTQGRADGDHVVDVVRASGGASPRSFVELAAAVAVDPPAPGQPVPPPGTLDLLADALARADDDPAVATALADAERLGRQRVAAAGSGADAFGNGWGTRRRGAAFGDDATYRAAFARVSLAGHLPAENRGYNHPIDGSRSWRLRFPPGGEPPVGAFWSLTLYGPDLFFVANALDRSSIGDRTPGLVRDPDGGLTIAIGAEPPRQADGRADTRNWLPAPAGPAVVVLRCYEGAAEVVDATWFPPALVEVVGAGRDERDPVSDDGDTGGAR